MSEQWRPIVGYEGRYEVSSNGQVRSVARVFIRSNGHQYTLRARVLSQWKRPDGHMSITLHHTDRSHRPHLVHQLVLAAFIGPCPAGMESLHWDDDPSNNAFSNLRYGTRSDNQLDLIRNGRHNNANKTVCVNGHEYNAENTIQRSDRRDCRPCMKERKRAYYQRKKTAA